MISIDKKLRPFDSKIIDYLNYLESDESNGVIVCSRQAVMGLLSSKALRLLRDGENGQDANDATLMLHFRRIDKIHPKQKNQSGSAKMNPNIFKRG